MIYTTILAKLQRAALNGERLHLDVDQARALVESPIYAMMADLSAQELAISWQSAPGPAAALAAHQPPPASNSAHSGSPGGPHGEPGASAGMIQPPTPAAQSASLSTTLTAGILHARQNKRSQRILRVLVKPNRKSAALALTSSQ